jgi:hypothetical protein
MYPMRRITSPTLLSLIVVSSFTLFCPPVWAQAAGPVTCNISPNVFRAGQQGSAIISMSSSSIPALALSTGDKFCFYFDAATGSVTMLPAHASVESSTLSGTDFSVSMGASPGQVVLTYNGQPSSLTYGNIISFEIGFTAAAQIGSGRVSFSSKFTNIVNGDLPYVPISIVDFGGAIVHDGTLTGNGSTGSPLGIAAGGVNTTQIASGAVTAAKIASGAVGTTQLADNSVTESKIAPAAVGSVQIATGAVGSVQLATGAVGPSNIANGTVVRSLNGLTDTVSLQAGSNITITPSGNTLDISSAQNQIVAYSGTGSVDNIGSTPTTVVSKDVPAGTYMVFARVQVDNFDGDFQFADCQLITADAPATILDAAGARIAPETGVKTINAGTGIITLETTATFPDPKTLIVNCSSFNATVQSVKLIALKIDSVF